MAFCPTGPGGGIDDSCAPAKTSLAGEANPAARTLTRKEAYALLKDFRRSGWEPATPPREGQFPKVRMLGGMFVINADGNYDVDVPGYRFSRMYTVFQSSDGGLHGVVIKGKKFHTLDAAAEFAETRWKMLVDQGRVMKPKPGTPGSEMYERAAAKQLQDIGPIDPDKPILPTGKPIPPGTAACPKCAGYGHIPAYGHVAEGVCFKCSGAGVIKAKKSKSMDYHTKAAPGAPAAKLPASKISKPKQPSKQGEFKDKRGHRYCLEGGKRVACAPGPEPAPKSDDGHGPEELDPTKKTQLNTPANGGAKPTQLEPEGDDVKGSQTAQQHLDSLDDKQKQELFDEFKEVTSDVNSHKFDPKAALHYRGEHAYTDWVQDQLAAGKIGKDAQQSPEQFAAEWDKAVSEQVDAIEKNNTTDHEYTPEEAQAEQSWQQQVVEWASKGNEAAAKDVPTMARFMGGLLNPLVAKGKFVYDLARTVAAFATADADWINALADEFVPVKKDQGSAQPEEDAKAVAEVVAGTFGEQALPVAKQMTTSWKDKAKITRGSGKYGNWKMPKANMRDTGEMTATEDPNTGKIKQQKVQEHNVDAYKDHWLKEFEAKAKKAGVDITEDIHDEALAAIDEHTGGTHEDHDAHGKVISELEKLLDKHAPPEETVGEDEENDDALASDGIDPKRLPAGAGTPALDHTGQPVLGHNGEPLVIGTAALDDTGKPIVGKDGRPWVVGPNGQPHAQRLSAKELKETVTEQLKNGPLDDDFLRGLAPTDKIAAVRQERQQTAPVDAAALAAAAASGTAGKPDARLRAAKLRAQNRGAGLHKKTPEEQAAAAGQRIAAANTFGQGSKSKEDAAIEAQILQRHTEEKKKKAQDYWQGLTQEQKDNLLERSGQTLGGIDVWLAESDSSPLNQGRKKTNFSDEEMARLIKEEKKKPGYVPPAVDNTAAPGPGVQPGKQGVPAKAAGLNPPALPTSQLQPAVEPEVGAAPAPDEQQTGSGAETPPADSPQAAPVAEEPAKPSGPNDPVKLERLQKEIPYERLAQQAEASGKSGVDADLIKRIKAGDQMATLQYLRKQGVKEDSPLVRKLKASIAASLPKYDAIFGEVEPPALPPSKLGKALHGKNNYFSECPRDEHGYCLPTGHANPAHAPVAVGDVLASHTDKHGYTVSIVYGVEPDHGEVYDAVMGQMVRTGQITITNPKGRKVNSGIWMSLPEKEWGLSNEQWAAMSLQERAALEVRHQATAYRPLKEQFRSRLDGNKGVPLGCVDEASMGYDQPSVMPDGGDPPAMAQEAPADQFAKRKLKDADEQLFNHTIARILRELLVNKKHYSRYIFSDLVREFRVLIAKLQQYGVQVPYLNDNQIAKIIQSVAGNVDPMQKQKSQESYFTDCPRDEGGHCKPSGQSGSTRPIVASHLPPMPYHDGRQARSLAKLQTMALAGDTVGLSRVRADPNSVQGIYKQDLLAALAAHGTDHIVRGTVDSLQLPETVKQQIKTVLPELQQLATNDRREHQVIFDAANGQELHRSVGTAFGEEGASQLSPGVSIPVELITGNVPFVQLHTHPEGGGGPSDGDWAGMGRGNTKVMLMVGPKETYVIERTTPDGARHPNPRELAESWEQISQEIESKPGAYDDVYKILHDTTEGMARKWRKHYKVTIVPSTQSKAMSWLNETSGGVLVKPPARPVKPPRGNRFKRLRARYKDQQGAQEGESYFGSCPRDDKGHCKPSGEADEKKPAKPKPKQKLKPSAIKRKPKKSKKPAKEFGRLTAARGKMMACRRVGKGKDAKLVMGNGKPAPAWILPSMVPPALKNVKVAVDPKAEVLVTGVNKLTGRGYTGYSDQFHMKAAANKFARINEMLQKDKPIYDQNQQNRKDPAQLDNADCAWLMDLQGTRPGSDADTKGVQQHFGKPMTPNMVVDLGNGKAAIQIGKDQVRIKDAKTAAMLLERKASGKGLENTDYWLNSYGATTLEGRHVIESKEGVRLLFVGKEGVLNNHLIKHPDLAKMLVDRKNKAGANGKLFNTDYAKVSKYVASLDGGKFTPKDLRTKRANLLALQHVAAATPPKTAAEYKSAVMSVAEKVSGVLGNKPAQALESYISPTVFHSWKQVADAD